MQTHGKFAVHQSSSLVNSDLRMNVYSHMEWRCVTDRGSKYHGVTA